MREIPGNMAWFGSYETFCRLLTKEGQKRSDLSPVMTAAAGALGGVGYWGSMFPIDTVKSKMQSGMEGSGM